MTIHFGIFDSSQQVQATPILQYGVNTNGGTAQATNDNGNKADPYDWIDVCEVVMKRVSNNSVFILEASGKVAANRSGNQIGIPVVRLARAGFGPDPGDATTILNFGQGEQAETTESVRVSGDTDDRNNYEVVNAHDVTTFTHTMTESYPEISAGGIVRFRLQLQCDRTGGGTNTLNANMGQSLDWGDKYGEGDYEVASLTAMEIIDL